METWNLPNGRRAAIVAQLRDCPAARLDEIIDPQYWGTRGDCTAEEHIAWLDSDTPENIAGWVDSIYRDVAAEEREAAEDQAEFDRITAEGGA